MARDVAIDGDETERFVAGVFACSTEIAAILLGRGRVRDYAAHACIVRQGDRHAACWLLILGRAHALLYSAEGQIVLLQDYGPGDVFGALGGTGTSVQEADVVAVDVVSALQVEGAELASLAERHGCIGLALSRMLLARLRRTTARMYERASLSAVGRVYSELLRQARESRDLTLRPTPILAELALRVATTRETASRAVNALERRGIIRRDAGGLTVVAPHRLEALIL